MVWDRGERRAAGSSVVMSRKGEADAVSRGGGGNQEVDARLCQQYGLGAERVNTFVGLGRRSMVCTIWQGLRVTRPSHSTNACGLPTGCEQRGAGCRGAK
jgi:hypothetical protein